jgi:hypothetical protein
VYACHTGVGSFAAMFMTLAHNTHPHSAEAVLTETSRTTITSTALRAGAVTVEVISCAPG